ncbi:MAG: methyl-accepting chemotaxis protein [Elusimicrobiota bacterium]
MENKQQFQRKTIIVKGNLQYRYMFIISFTSLVAFMLVALDILWSVHKVVTLHPAMIPLLDEIFSNIPIMMFKLLIYIFIVIIASAVISHKIAGPIYKFEKSCQKIAEGDLTHRVYLRKGDSLIELQDAFNNMMEKLHYIIKVNENFRKELKDKNIELEKIEKIDKEIKEKIGDLKV